MKMEQTECSETSAYKIHTPGNYPEENIQHTEHGESLKSRILGNWKPYPNFCWAMKEFCVECLCIAACSTSLDEKTRKIHYKANVVMSLPL